MASAETSKSNDEYLWCYECSDSIRIEQMQKYDCSICNGRKCDTHCDINKNYTCEYCKQSELCADCYKYVKCCNKPRVKLDLPRKCGGYFDRGKHKGPCQNTNLSTTTHLCEYCDARSSLFNSLYVDEYIQEYYDEKCKGLIYNSDNGGCDRDPIWCGYCLHCLTYYDNYDGYGKIVVNN